MDIPEELLAENLACLSMVCPYKFEEIREEKKRCRNTKYLEQKNRIWDHVFQTGKPIQQRPDTGSQGCIWGFSWEDGCEEAVLKEDMEKMTHELDWKSVATGFVE